MPDDARSQQIGNNLIPLPPPRIPYHPDIKERFEVDAAGWRALIDAVWPAAKTMSAVVMALSYCKARNLDPFKRPVHIVPVWSSEVNAMVESVWPGIGELRTTAFRTGLYAGRDVTEFGPDRMANLDGVDITYPEWAQVTVYRLSRSGDRMPFPGPRVYWFETYATAKRTTTAPNAMWKKRPRGQLDKCAEAAALRAAFPEELGNEYAADEMAGQMIEHAPAPPRPRPEDYATEATPAASAEQTEATASFEVTNFVGEVRDDFATEMAALEALAGLMGEARSLRSLDGLIESNPVLAKYPEIIAVYKDQKDALANPGNGQDRPGTGAQPSDPARGATHQQSRGVVASTADSDSAGAGSNPAATTNSAGMPGQTEHPEEQQSSTQTERMIARVVADSPQAKAADAAAPRDEPKLMRTPETLQKLAEAKTPQHLLYWTRKAVAECRDPGDIDELWQNNEARYKGLGLGDQKEVKGLFEQRNRELAA